MTEKEKYRLPVELEHKAKDMQTVINVQNAIIEELESLTSRKKEIIHNNDLDMQQM